MQITVGGGEGGYCGFLIFMPSATTVLKVSQLLAEYFVIYEEHSLTLPPFPLEDFLLLFYPY